MKLFARAKQDALPERRSGPRTRVDCLAKMLMPSGDRPGRLFDISANGARFHTEVPPAKGSSGILDWTVHEAYCHVTWSAPGMCGVTFDKPLNAKALRDTIDAAAAGALGAASADNDVSPHPSGQARPTRLPC
ncbi:PilZ domain-containing protein [Aurantiacibacter aquimixticola]|uniref:PilZ domain-containing protein n=1 Tax=Aurantiacibacter aquimixticola TaxID=1958945 RepID=A0A419RSC9_9SPHN|nr:PilZ domain-containing protein [Aurantiacibacter aquimixticola]RJY08688.1 PilZ domain-containing protein [Aurantiacibacter aquimixticola]